MFVQIQPNKAVCNMGCRNYVELLEIPAGSIDPGEGPEEAVRREMREELNVDVEVGAEIFEEILAVASGKKTKSEQYGIGDEEFVPWPIGPTL